jgi:hypothetical protein
MNKLEALLDALGNLNGAFTDPGSTAYKLRNPLMLKSFGPPGKHETDDEGRRKFTSLVAGYRAGYFDLEKKISGSSRANIKTTDTLASLLRVYGISDPGNVKKIISFLRRALQDEKVSEKTILEYFNESVRLTDKE